MDLKEAKEILNDNGYYLTEEKRRFDFDNFIDLLKSNINFPLNKLRFSSDYTLGNSSYPHCKIRLRGTDGKLGSQKLLAEFGYELEYPWLDILGLKVIFFDNDSHIKTNNVYKFEELTQEKIKEFADKISKAAIDGE